MRQNTSTRSNWIWIYIYRHNDLYIYAQFQINRQIIQTIWSFIYTTPNSKELSENGRVVLLCLEVGLTFWSGGMDFGYNLQSIRSFKHKRNLLCTRLWLPMLVFWKIFWGFWSHFTVFFGSQKKNSKNRQATVATCRPSWDPPLHRLPWG